jgi:short-subunit dehydrogenase
MAISLKPLHDQVIVITGASSGIGLATARAAAAKGASLVLASRSDEALTDIVHQINREGGQAVHVVADVGNREDVQRIADVAMQHFGGFDTWINNAGVSIYGRLDEVSDEDNRKLFDTNFWGVVYGSLTAAEHLRRRGGAIINIGSVLSEMSIPIQGMYSASKHAVKGFTDSLRIELEEEGAPISVTLVKPAAINTPYPQHARNYTDKEPTLPPPVYQPEEVAYAILHAAERQQRDITVGGGGKAMTATNKLAPGMMDWLSEKLMPKQQVKDRPTQHRRSGLHEASGSGKVHGDYEGYVMKKSIYTRAKLNPIFTGAVIAAAGLFTLALMNREALTDQLDKLKTNANNGDSNRLQNKGTLPLAEKPLVVPKINITDRPDPLS